VTAVRAITRIIDADDYPGAVTPWALGALASGLAVTPEKYGAAGGGADDTSAVQQALDSGKPVFLTKLYRVTATLTLKTTGQRVWGAGYQTGIQFDGSAVPKAFAMLDATQRQFIELVGFRITSTAAGQGTAVDASHFATGAFVLNIDGVNKGVDINSNDAFYNLVSGRIQVSGAGSVGVRIQNGANENTLSRMRIVTDANSTGVLVDAHSCGLYEVDVETGAAIGIDVGANGHGTLICAPYLEANAINLRLASGVKGVTRISGTIESATTADVQDNGAVGFQRIGAYTAFAADPMKLSMGTSSLDAMLLDMAQPTTPSQLRDSHSLLLRGTYADSGGVGHNSDYRVLVNVTSNTGGSKLRVMQRTDAASYVEKFSVDGSGVGVFGGRVQIGGPLQVPFVAKTANYTISATTDAVVTGDGGAGGITITLPSAVNIQGRRFTVKRINGTAGSVVVNTTSSQTIDGALTKTLGNQWAWVEVVSDGANWIIVAQGGTVT